MASTIAALTAGGGGVATTADSSGNLNLLSGTTTVLALTATGVAVTGTLSATSPTFVTPILGTPTSGVLTNCTGLPALSTASGSAPSYSARAWVNFNGTGTVAIRASGNVSSITDNGVGLYTVNFTTAMPDANYSAGGSVSKFNIYNDGNQVIQIGGVSGSLQTTSACKVATSHSSSTLVDCEVVTAIFFR